MRRITAVWIAGLGVALALGPGRAAAEGAKAVPFELGTFELQGRTFVGLVLGDATVVDVAAANAALEKAHPAWPRRKAPSDMKDLIARYEPDGLQDRLHAMAADPASTKAPYAHELTSLKVRPPIMYPETMLNAAVNYSEHDTEMSGRAAAPPSTPAVTSRSAPGLWERRPDDARWNPYLFLKPRSAVIAEGETIRIPPGRDQIDWECELLLVIGRRANHVPLEKAGDYVFGYSMENDVSDRGGRGDNRMTPDWLVGKAHDTFAPQGPFIVPKEFVPDAQKLGIQFRLSGTLMQDSSTARMTHSVLELLQYASNVMTLQPGDVISTGSPAGVGSARNPPIFMKAGDVAACTIERVGTLTNPVGAAEATK